ncbi:MAG: hypothetical protein IKZ88_07825 [Neisseriaceae bacterium]|nr:hypothetical protein [Neisseriaceae bacterium]
MRGFVIASLTQSGVAISRRKENGFLGYLKNRFAFHSYEIATLNFVRLAMTVSFFRLPETYILQTIH